MILFPFREDFFFFRFSIPILDFLHATDQFPDSSSVNNVAAMILFSFREDFFSSDFLFLF